MSGPVAELDAFITQAGALPLSTNTMHCAWRILSSVRSQVDAELASDDFPASQVIKDIVLNTPSVYDLITRRNISLAKQQLLVTAMMAHARRAQGDELETMLRETAVNGDAHGVFLLFCFGATCKGLTEDVVRSCDSTCGTWCIGCKHEDVRDLLWAVGVCRV